MSFKTADSALRSFGRMARTAELRKEGVSEAELACAVRDGRVVRPRQGVYALPDTAASLIHAAEHGGTVGCCTAGVLHGLWVLAAPEETHVWMGRAGTSRQHCEDCRLHWDVGAVKVGEVPPLATVLLQIAVCADEDTFFAALESALRQSLLSSRDLTLLRNRLPTRMRWLVAFARADADSGLESLIRLRLYRIGIRVRTQVSITGVGEVDFVIGHSLIVEADGVENHAGDKARAKDLRRDAAASALGYETLRFTYAMIVHHWQSVEDAIVGAVARHAHA